MRNVFLLAMAVLFLVSCAAIKQGVQDYKTGKNTPLTNGEISPEETANSIKSTVEALPFPWSGPASTVLGTVVLGFLTWKRGVAIRKNDGTIPVAMVAKTNTLTGILQDVANIAAGAFSTASTQDVTTAMSIWQRIWKVGLATVGAGGALALTNPSFQAYLLAHPITSTLFVGITSGIAGIEKALSNVPKVSTPTTPTTTSGA